MNATEWQPWINTVLGFVGPLIAVWVAVRLGRTDKNAARAARRIEDMYSGYLTFTATSVEHDKAVDQRMTDVMTRLGSHEETCTKRWGELQREHGELLTTVRRLERLEERRVQILEE